MLLLAKRLVIKPYEIEVKTQLCSGDGAVLQDSQATVFMPHLVRQLMSAITTDFCSVKPLQRPKQQHMLHQIKGLLERVNWLRFQ